MSRVYSMNCSLTELVSNGQSAGPDHVFKSPRTGRVQFNEQKHVNDKVLEEITGLTDFSSTGRDRFNDQKHVSDKVLEETT